MGAVLRFTLLILWLSYACGHGYHSTRGAGINRHYYRPHAQTYKYNYPTYNQHYPTYQKPRCSAKTPCYEQLLVITGDAVPNKLPNPAGFIYHYKKAGFDKYAIIEEGKRAAQFFKHQYGVDVGYLPDEAYLAPNITLANGMRFSFGTTAVAPNAERTPHVAAQLPPTGRRILPVAAQRDAVQFPNALVTISGWTLSFPKDFDSYGYFTGKIPAGSGAGFGSYIIEVCPDESPYNPCRSTLSRKPKGQIFIKYRSRTFQTPGIVDCNLVHEEWGPGHIIGAVVKTEADGVVHDRSVLTFPRSCDSRGQCFAKPWGE